jgi:hypothetical protein
MADGMDHAPRRGHAPGSADVVQGGMQQARTRRGIRTGAPSRPDDRLESIEGLQQAPGALPGSDRLIGDDVPGLA